MHGCKVQSMEQLAGFVRRGDIQLGVLTVPAEVAQPTAERMIPPASAASGISRRSNCRCPPTSCHKRKTWPKGWPFFPTGCTTYPGPPRYLILPPPTACRRRKHTLACDTCRFIPIVKFRHSAELNGATRTALNPPPNVLRTHHRSHRNRVGGLPTGLIDAATTPAELAAMCMVLLR